MSQLIVRNLEPGLLRKLKKRAAAHGVSQEEEHRRILRTALSTPDDDFPDLKAALGSMPDVAEDADFERIRERPRKMTLR